MVTPNNMNPLEVVARAKHELRTAEHISASTSEQLLAEVMAWRARFPQYVHRPQDEVVTLRYVEKD